MIYRPDTRWEVDWDGDGIFPSKPDPNSDITGDIYNYDTKHGAEIAVDQSSIRVVGARGQIEVFDRKGKYSSEGPNAFNPDGQRKRQMVRFRVDNITAWQGLVEPFQPVQVPNDHRRALARLRGKFHDRLGEQVEFTSIGGNTLSSLLNDAAVGMLPQSRFNNTPLGVITFTGSVRQFLSQAMTFEDGYAIENKFGNYLFYSARQLTTEGTFLLDKDSYDVFYPLSEQYPRVDGVRNRMETNVRAVAAGNVETISTIRQSISAGDTLTRVVKVDDDSIINVQGWTSPVGLREPAASISVFLSHERARQVTVAIRNNTPDSVPVRVGIQGVPYRITELGGFLIQRDASIASYGVRDATSEQPNWWSYAGESAANDILNRLDTPLQFARASLPGWQETKAQTDAIYGIGAGTPIRVNVESEEEGVPDLNLNMLVMSVRYVGQLNRMPRVEWDLLELPTDYSGETWQLGKVGSGELGTKTILR